MWLEASRSVPGGLSRTIFEMGSHMLPQKEREWSGNFYELGLIMFLSLDEG
jgi:hypothetical protein